MVKSMIIKKLAVVSARLLGLGSRLYPSNMPRMLNRDLTRFMQSFSSTPNKRKKGSAGRFTSDNYLAPFRTKIKSNKRSIT